MTSKITKQEKPAPKKPRVKTKGPQDLASIAREFRKQPKPRNRMIDVLAYAAVKTIDHATVSEQTISEKTAQNGILKTNYQNALKASKEIAANPPSEKATARQRTAYERKSNRLLEALLLAKVALTLDVLGIPPTGKPEEDIYNIGMNCIGHLDYRFAAPGETPLQNEADPFFFDKPKKEDAAGIRKQAQLNAHKIAVAQYFNTVLYDLKTEDVLRFDHPELNTDSAVSILSTAYQSLFVMKLVKKKPVYRIKRDIFKGEKHAANFIKSLEALETRLGLMNLTPESTGTMVTEGRLLLAHDKPSGAKVNRSGLFKNWLGGRKSSKDTIQ